MDQIFAKVVERLNNLCVADSSYVQAVKSSGDGRSLVFETAFGDVEGDLRLEGEDVILQMGSQKEVVLPISEFLGKPN